MFSRRSEHDFEPNAIALALAERRASSRPILDLTLSNPTEAGLPYARERILAALGDPAALRYGPHPFGLPAARAAVQALYREQGFELGLDRILLTASTSEAYAFLFKVLCDPGDEILLPAPSYPLFEHLSQFEGITPSFYWLEYDGAWHIDFASLERARSPRSKGIVVVSPNNPTGSFVKRGELARLGGLGLPIISDEVFGSYALGEDPERARSALELDGALVFALGGLSKLAALPQLKLAWTAISGPSALAEEACRRLELVADTFLSPSAPPQLALPELLAASRGPAASLRSRIARNYAALRAHLAGSSLTVLHLEGGWYAVLELPAFCDEAAFVLALLREDGVLTQPGYFYDFARGQHLIVSLITPEAELDEGARRIAERAP